MKSSYLTNLVLIIVIASLFWLNQQSSTNTEIALSDIKADSIHEIVIKRAHGSDIEIVKQAEGWQLIHPLKADGNKARVELLLSILNSPIHNQLSHPKDDTLNQLGLKPVKSSLQLNEQLFIFGDVEPIDKHRYVLLNNTVYLIDDLISPLLNSNATSFINNRLFSSFSTITKAQLPLLKDGQLDTTSTITISNENGSWQSSDSLYANDKLTAVMENWQQAAALQVTETLNQEGEIVVLLWLNNNPNPTEFLFQLDTHSLYITNTEKQLNYHFPVALAQQLLLPLIESN